MVTTIAGLAPQAVSTDGIGTSARFYRPAGIASDSTGTLWVVDQSNHTLRKVTPGGTVTTPAGLAGTSGTADGTGAASRFQYPIGIATDANGNLYIFNSSNVELMMKILDGRSVNGHFWVLYGVLSDVEYTVTVQDTTTGAVKTYLNPARRLASLADVNAF